MSLMGEDGLGYELAKKLETNGSWKLWLGDNLHSQLLPHLISSASWKLFMSVNPSKSTSDLQLQIRVRALLFDKASAPLFSPPSSSNACYSASSLQLHADDVYYSLEEDFEDWTRLEADGSLTVESLQMKGSNGSLKRYFSSTQISESVGIRSIDCTIENPLRSKNGEMIENWYSQWREKQLLNRMQRLSWRLAQQELPFGERETSKRTAEGMSAYLTFVQKHKKRCRYMEPAKISNCSREASSVNDDNSSLVADSSAEEHICFFPETMFPFNCVPECSVIGLNDDADVPKTETFGIFENLPCGKSPLLIERFGMESEYLSLGVNTGKSQASGIKKILSDEEVLHLSKQTIAQIVAGIGFDGLTERSLDVLSQLLSGHISKLGRILRILADSYRKHHSQTEILRMFLRSIGHSNFWTLLGNLKSGSRLSSQSQQEVVQPTQQQVIPSHVQQVQRQLPRQFLLQQQNSVLALQQQQFEKMRRNKQQVTLRTAGRKLEKDRSLGDIKIENNNIDSSLDSKQSVSLLSQNHAQWPQQSAQGSQHLQSISQYKHFSPSQIPHVQQQGLMIQDSDQIRAQPVKVEGFQELMGGNINMKQEMEVDIAHSMTSPRK